MSHLATWPNVRRRIGGKSGVSCDAGHSALNLRLVALLVGNRPGGRGVRAGRRRRGIDAPQHLSRELEDERPSYYGAARVALARVMLDTDWLGRCG